MSTWNRKARVECGKLQTAKDAPKRQVQCIKCNKAHDHPVCDGRHAAFIKAGEEIKRKKKLREYKRKGLTRDKQQWNIEQNKLHQRRQRLARRR